MSKKLTEAELKVHYKKTCLAIEGHLRRQGANAVGIQKAGRHIGWIQRKKGYACEDFQTFDAWREAKLRFSAEWASKYLLIGSTFKPEELSGLQLGVQALAAIARMKPELRPALLKHGQRHEAAVIRAAYKRVGNMPLDKAVEVIAKVLARPEGSERGRTRVSSASLPLPQHVARCKRALSTVLGELRGVKQRLQNGDELPAEERVALSARLEFLMSELFDINQILTGRDTGSPAPTQH